MKHPNPDEWTLLIYGECDDVGRKNLEFHLAGCQECRLQLEQLRKIQGLLDAYKVPEKASGASSISRRIFWPAMAASLAFLLGALAMRFTHFWTPGDAELQARLRPAIQKELQTLLGSNFKPTSTPSASQAGENGSSPVSISAPNDSLRLAFADFMAVCRNDRAEDRAVLADAIRTLEQQRRSDYIRLRNDLETVALTANEQLNSTRSDLSRLAIYTTADERNVTTPHEPAKIER